MDTPLVMRHDSRVSALADATTTVNGSFVPEVAWGAVVVVGVTLILVFASRAVFTARQRRQQKSGAGTAGRSPGGLLIGMDNRLSTSKTIAVAWTLVVAWMVVTVGFVAASSTGTTFSGIMHGASDLYLVFLGGPYAAAVFAKVSTTANVNQGRLVKTPGGQPNLADVISDDNGNVDLYDFQYTLFNLIAMIIVIFTFASQPGHGLPSIPDFLAVLTGGSALTYTVNKAVASSGPQIQSVSPNTARVGDVITITGTQLLPQGTTANNPTVTVGGVAATDVTPVAGTANTLIATIAAAPAGQSYPSGPVQVVVTAADGTVAALNGAVTVSADQLALSGATSAPAPVQANALVTVTGQWLFPAGTSAGTASAGAAPVGGPAATLTTSDGRPWPVTFEGPYSITTITLRVGADPGPPAGQTATLTVTRSPLPEVKLAVPARYGT